MNRVVSRKPRRELLAGSSSQQSGKAVDRYNSEDKPDFCGDDKLEHAYNALWDSIGISTDYLSDEVWSWNVQNGDFKPASLGRLPPPPQGVAKSDVA